MKSMRFTMGYAMLLACGGFYFGFYENFTHRLVLVYLKNEFGMDRDWRSIAIVLTILFRYVFLGRRVIFFSIGCGIGVLVSGFIMDRIGRIKTIVANECVILGIFCMFQITNITVLCINFGLTGLTAGVLLHTSIVINLELVPKSISPMSGIFFVIFYCIALQAEE